MIWDDFFYLINGRIPFQKPKIIKTIETKIPSGRNINFDNFIVFSIPNFFLDTEALGLVSIYFLRESGLRYIVIFLKRKNIPTKKNKIAIVLMS